jgi:hypothetical protein
MMNDKNSLNIEIRIKAFQWLFRLSLFQLIVCFLLPLILFPGQSLLPIELFIALTVGVVFGIYFWGVNIYGIFIDGKRRVVYVVLAIIMSLWFIWVVVSWLFIDQMHYLT